MVLELENCLSEALSPEVQIPPNMMKTMQSVDYIRQSLRDMERMMAIALANPNFTADARIELQVLAREVQLRDSLPIASDARARPSSDDVWF